MYQQANPNGATGDTGANNGANGETSKNDGNPDDVIIE